MRKLTVLFLVMAVAAPATARAAEVGASEAGPSPAVDNGYAVAEQLGVADELGLVPLDDAGAAQLAERLGVVPEPGEAVRYTLALARSDSQAVVQLLVDGPTSGRMVTTIDPEGAAEPFQVTSRFGLDPAAQTVTVDVYGPDGELLGTQTVSGGQRCEVDGSQGACLARSVAHATSKVACTAAGVATGIALKTGVGWLVAGVAGLICVTAVAAEMITKSRCSAYPPCPNSFTMVECYGTDFCWTLHQAVLPYRIETAPVFVDWRTVPAPGYFINNNVNIRTHKLSTGPFVDWVMAGGVAPLYVYQWADVVWHSDIRCDQLVSVQFRGGSAESLIVEGITQTNKDVPPNPFRAYCSHYDNW